MKKFLFIIVIFMSASYNIDAQDYRPFYGFDVGIGGNFYPNLEYNGYTDIVNWSLDFYYGKQYNDRLSYIIKLDVSRNGYRTHIGGGWFSELGSGNYDYIGLDNHYMSSLYLISRNNLFSKSFFLDVGFYYSRLVVRDIYNRLEIEGEITPLVDPFQKLHYFDSFNYKRDDFGFIVGLGKEIKLRDKLYMPIEVSFQKGFIDVIENKQRNLFYLDVGLKFVLD